MKTRRLVAALLVCIAGGTPASGQMNRERAQLSEEARSLLRPRMQRHVPAMDRLVRSVLLLDRPGTVAAVDAVLEEARLARPLPGDKESINAAIPTLFFDLQDHLHDRASVLRRAATNGDDVEVAVAFGEVMQSCVACHSSYLPRGPRRR